jgi:hypothetical protein
MINVPFVRFEFGGPESAQAVEDHRRKKKKTCNKPKRSKAPAGAWRQNRYSG